MNFNTKILNLFEQQQFSNPLEEARKIVAPLCMKSLNDLIINCNDCNNTFDKQIAYGNPNANIMIINDVATNNEDVKEYFNTLLDIAEINKNDLFIINSVSCVCQRKRQNEYEDRLPSLNEVNNCKYFIDYAIQFVRPRIIISMGATALSMFNKDMTFLDAKNKFLQYNGIKTLVSFSVKDIFDLSKFQTEEENQVVADEVLNNLILAKEYVNNIRR